jgi:hypothetical protein
MSTDRGPILIGRAGTLPFVVLEWCFVFWYARRLPVLSRTKFSKLAAGAMWICVCVGVPVGQFLAYIWVVHPKRLNDPFLMLVIFVESLISVCILFRVLIQRRTRGRSSEDAP